MMKFVYFTLPDGRYLVMNNLQSEGDFKKNDYHTPTLFPKTTDVSKIYSKIKPRVDIDAIQTKTFSM